MDGETYVRRRHWSAKEKRAVVTEALTSGNVIGTAKRHGIQAQQIYRWRERLEAFPAPPPAAFLPLSVVPDPALPSPAPVLDEASRDSDLASRLDRSPRLEIVLSAGRRIIVDEGVDTDAVLRLVRGLEALR